MQIFMHTSAGVALVDLPHADSTASSLAAMAGIPDADVWVEDAETPLEQDGGIAESAGDKGHVHISNCRTIAVTINYGGTSKERDFTPNMTIQAVRQWAVGENGFDLPTNERPKHEVGLCGSGVVADRNDHIGTLATACALCLDLAPKDRFQG